jgi:hypothetical protein
MVPWQTQRHCRGALSGDIVSRHPPHASASEENQHPPGSRHIGKRCATREGSIAQKNTPGFGTTSAGQGPRWRFRSTGLLPVCRRSGSNPTNTHQMSPMKAGGPGFRLEMSNSAGKAAFSMLPGPSVGLPTPPRRTHAGCGVSESPPSSARLVSLVRSIPRREVAKHPFW